MRVRIDRLGHRGDGIAEGPVYVPGALPGEEVEGDLDGDRIEAPRILSRSADRTEPPCPNYATCGGCALMHASDPFVGRWKVGIVRQALEARGLPAPIRGIATSPPQSRRRATFSGRRTKSGVIVGFHGRRSDTITRIGGCRVLLPQILAAMPVLERLTDAAASRKGAVSVVVTHGCDGLDVAIRGGAEAGRDTLARLARIAADAGLARLSLDGETVAQDRPPAQRFGGVRAVPPPGAFLQATEQGQSALLACVSRALGPAGRVVDLFAGCGTFALPVSRRAEVHAVEGDAAMTEALVAAWRAGRGHRPLTATTRDLFRDPLAAAELSGFDAAIIDPPRAGAAAQTAEIAASGIGTVAAISCNPVTFARDAERLVDAGFALDWVRVVDQFRWSPHVELAAAFSRGEKVAP